MDTDRTALTTGTAPGPRLRAMVRAWNTPRGWLRAWRLLALLVLLMCFGSVARAQSCSVRTQPVVFGTYNPVASQALDGTGQLQVTCKTPFIATLDKGGANSYTPRAMRSGGNLLQYNLYVDANRSRVFGDGTGGTQAIACNPGTSTASCIDISPGNSERRTTVPFYGRIPPDQDAVAGDYADTVRVTITF